MVEPEVVRIEDQDVLVPPSLEPGMPDLKTLYWQPMPSVTLPSEAFQVPLRNVSDSSNVAMTVRSLSITRSHALLDATPAHAPPQAVKVVEVE